MKKILLPVLALLMVFSSYSAGYGAANSIVGTWAYSRLRHINPPTESWSIKNGELTYNADGTGSDTNQYNNAGAVGTLTEAFTYSAASNPDGSVTVTHTYPTGLKRMRRFVVSDDGNMMIMDGAENLLNQRLRALIKRDPARTYSNADLSGEYYIAGYEYDQNGGQQGFYSAWSGIHFCDGAGTYTNTATLNSDGNVFSTVFSGPYAVSPDGSILYDSTPKAGYMSGNGNLLSITPGLWLLGNPDYTTFFGVKKADRPYSAADLSGTWALTGFGDDNGTSINSEIGTMTCDAAGNCNMHLLNQRDGNLSYDIGSAVISVAPDGSFGTSLGDLAPAYAGAIGNNGNAIAFNVSLNSASLWHREIFIGVKCSACTKISTWFEDSSNIITYSGVWTDYPCAGCNGGGLKYAGATGSRADFKFTGTGIKWTAAKGPMMGKAKVSLDGVFMGNVDLYNPTNKLKSVFPKAGLTPGAHTLTIEVSGLKNPSSTGTIVNIDSFEVTP